MLASALWSQLLINWQWSALIRTLDQDHGTSPGRRLAQIPAGAVMITLGVLILTGEFTILNSYVNRTIPGIGSNV